MAPHGHAPSKVFLPRLTAEVSPWPPVNSVVLGVTPPCATLAAEVSALTAITSGALASCGGGGGGGGGAGVEEPPKHIIKSRCKKLPRV